jgi:hypothetical protein
VIICTQKVGNANKYPAPRVKGKEIEMLVYDFSANKMVEVMELNRQTAGDASLVDVELRDENGGVRFAVIEYPDGVIFTPWDWQGQQPKSPDEIEEYKWVDDKGNEAIMLNGLPRKLSGE